MKIKAYLLKILAPAFLVFFLAIDVSGQWQNITIDTLTSGGIRKFTGLQSISLDFMGYSHVAWRHQLTSGWHVIHYTTNSPDGQWQPLQAVCDSSQVVYTPMIAVSPVDDMPYIVYASNGMIYFVYQSDNDWLSEAVSFISNDNYGPTIAIDESGMIHIAWIATFDNRNEYKIAYVCGAAGEWNEQILYDSYLGEYGMGASPYIDADSEGKAHIVYRGGDYGSYHIHHAWNIEQGSDDWQYEVIYSNNINDFAASIALDADDGLHIAMSGNDGWGFPSRVYYNIKPDGDTWQNAQLVSLQASGGTPSLGLDIFGNPHVAWMGVSGNILTGYIYYSYRDDAGNWQDQLLLWDDYFEPCLRVDHFGQGKLICSSGGNTADYDIFHVSGEIATTIEDESDLRQPISTYKLWQNYPNPFNKETIINYRIPRSGHVVLSVFDILGKKVTTLVDEFQDQGEHELKWDSSEIATGIYFYYLQFEQSSLKKKAILLK